MRERGQSLAVEHQANQTARRGRFLLRRLDENENAIRAACSVLADSIRHKRTVTPAGEWLLDNLYLIDEHIRLGRRHLPVHYSSELTALASGPSAGCPRVYDIAFHVIAHGDGRFDEESLRNFLHAYQGVSPLSLGELWAIPIMLRFALIENLRRVAVRVHRDSVDRAIADDWAQQMIDVAAADSTNLILLVADMARSNVDLTSSFVSQMSRRLLGQGSELLLPTTWLEHRLAVLGSSMDQLVQTAQRELAADQISVSNSIGSLRLLDAVDWREFVEGESPVETILREDPLGTYPRMDFFTRDAYRHVIERVAKRSRRSEIQVAQDCLALAQRAHASEAAVRRRHVGYYLVSEGLRELTAIYMQSRRFLPNIGRRTGLYFLGLLMLEAMLAAGPMLHLYHAPGGATARIVAALALALFLSEAAIVIGNRFAAVFCRAAPLPRMDFTEAVPTSAKTLVVIPSLLESELVVRELAERLEVAYLANRDAQIHFALLTDFTDSATEHAESDARILTVAEQAIRELNAAHEEQPFLLLHRPRRWNEAEGCWMGFERKRGKLSDLNALLRSGERAPFSRIVGAIDELDAVRYVISLDADTQLPRDAARKLIAAMEHPLNRPRVSDAGVVVEGYAILQPRVGNAMTRELPTRYAHLFGDEPGVDPYTRIVSNTYQDLFGEGSFIGKGIYDVEVFEQVLEQRFPDDRILSHDLLEGCYARSGMISDVELFEHYPRTYATDWKRRHRWIRGDWQIAAWIAGSVPTKSARERNPLSFLSCWKIFDNLRRSLVAPAQLMLLLLGWFWFAKPAFWSALIAAILLLPMVLDVLIELPLKPEEAAWRQHIGRVFGGAWQRLLRLLFVVACLPHEALSSLDAIVRTWWRVHVSRRRLLQWRTSSAVEHSDRGSFAAALEMLALCPLFAVGTVVLAVLLKLSIAPLLPWCALWFMSPLIAQHLGRPRLSTDEELSPGQVQFVRSCARRTWRFFEDFVGAEDHWLPPDNYQLGPLEKLAHRTSPTNIGLSLLANLSALDLGYLTLSEFIARSTQTLESMQALQRYRGHFYNWYDTTTLQPMPPWYVSSVDSGNLVGHLLTFRQGLLERCDEPVMSTRIFSGLADTAALLHESCGSAGAEQHAALAEALLQASQASIDPKHMVAALRTIQMQSTQLRDSLGVSANAEAVSWANKLVAQCAAALDQIVAFEVLDAMPLAGSIAPLNSVLHALAATCANLAAEVDYDFLFDSSRSLFMIGFNTGDQRPDTAAYDLLASEARLGVFVAIAQGKVPQEAWFALGRLLTPASGSNALLSWSGSMFEYLMPHLVMPLYPGTLLDQSCRAAVERQIDYADEHDVPWGISESGFAQLDAAQNYQYRAFGCPGLGLQRGLSGELVIAPYACALAMLIKPADAVRNLKRMRDLGWLSPHGFYEAIDYTASRLAPGETHSVVRSFMAHHQGMALLAFAHAIAGPKMQERFAADPQLRATLLLLQERVPRAQAISATDVQMVDVRSEDEATQTPLRVFSDAARPRPAVQLLSNGRYHVMMTHVGGGYSHWNELAITRWHEDATRDNWGFFCYLRDVAGGALWSTTPQPTMVKVDRSEAIFSDSSIEFRRVLDQVEAYTRIVVSPEDDIELRRTRLTNRSPMLRVIEVTSYAEIVLATPIADALHPAFSNLFVQSEIVADAGAILCMRRPRSAEEAPRWMFHLFAVQQGDDGPAEFESDRMKFLGRGNDVSNPAALQGGARLSGSDGSVLDPIVAIRRRITLEAGQSVTFNLVLGVAADRDASLALLQRYRDWHLADRAFDLAWTHNRVALGQINISEAEAQVYAQLLGNIIYPNPARRASAAVIASNRLGQPGLWRYAISGDLPIVLLRISDAVNISLARRVVHAHRYARTKGLVFDLVIWNEERGGYRHTLTDELTAMISSNSDVALLERPGGVFLRSVEHVNQEDRVLMQSVARVVLSDQAGTLAEQLRSIATSASEPPIPRLTPVRETEPPAISAPLVPRQLELANGFGGFSADGREYVITSGAGQRTPLPWVNVIANPSFGCVVSESGASYTWAQNAHEYRLTPWSNDPVSDASGEVFYLRDDQSGDFWSPTPLPADDGGPYVTRHGFGYSVFEHEHAGIVSNLRVHVDANAPVKFFSLKLRNQSGRPRKLSVTGYIEWVLGDLREKNAMHVVTELDASGALLARNAYSTEFADAIAFFDVDNPRRTLSGDRTEFVGRNGSLRSPAAMRRRTLSGRVGASIDPCGAIQIPFELAEGETRDFIFRLGVGRDRNDASALIARFRRNGSARDSFDEVQALWRDKLGALSVQTPDASINFLVNGWLLYQVTSCRLWGRSGFYQSGGAFGFRDQLQDAMSLVLSDPGALRKQILASAARQFVEGDVQHWWHPPAGRGVRTQCSDDYLWLPLAVARYLKASADFTLLDEGATFLEGRPLNEHEESYYDLPVHSSAAADIYTHCVRALERGMVVGRHGLPLIGSGDWNDGMNNVGRDGAGESVWLAFFLCHIIDEFAPIARGRGDAAFAQKLDHHAARLRESIESQAWDGAWYRRAFYDDGTPLGSAANQECRIDSIAQSWSVLSGAADPARAAQAMQSLDEQLVDEHAGLIRLLTPPFNRAERDPGYIAGYVPGVRENGGQYTHAAIWAIMAFARGGQIERAWQLLDFVNPLKHAVDRDAANIYKVEPYVAAADVLAIGQHAGRGGWTWYTGSAGWLYRLIVESLLGITRAGDRLEFAPRLPRQWTGYRATYSTANTHFDIEIRQDATSGTNVLTLDGEIRDDFSVPISSDGKKHIVDIVLGVLQRDGALQ